MAIITVNIFNGTKSQIPRSYEVEGNIYQDIITNLIKYGLESGQIYSLNGDHVQYNNIITLGEVNYIIPDGESYNVDISTVNGGTFHIPVKHNGIVRDIYNILISKGFPLDTKLIAKGNYLDLDKAVNDYNLLSMERITVITTKDTGTTENSSMGGPQQRENNMLVNINVSTPEGKTFTIPVNPDGTVREIYNELVAKGFPYNTRLIANNAILDLDRTIRDYNLLATGRIIAVVPENTKIITPMRTTNILEHNTNNRLVNINVSTPEGKTFTIPVNPDGTVREIYNELVAKGFPYNIRLIANNAILDLDRTIKDYNLLATGRIMVISR